MINNLIDAHKPDPVSIEKFTKALSAIYPYLLLFSYSLETPKDVHKLLIIQRKTKLTKARAKN